MTTAATRDVSEDSQGELAGRRALITGACRDAGLAIAHALVKAGAAVVMTGPDRDNGEAAAREVAGAGGQAMFVRADPGSDADWVAATAAAEQVYGGLDILVANAGVTRDGLLMRMKDEDWADVQRVNLESYFRLARAAMRGMMKRRSGRIIGITSVVGVTGNPGQTNYAASKAGMIGFSKALAQEVASRGITVNCVAPGFIASPMTDALNEAQKAQIMGRIPLGRLGEGSDVAAACVYLASAAGAYVTGQTLHVNGGMAMI